MTRLLILSCSRNKVSTSDLLPAIERYDGPAFRVLRRFWKQSSERPETYVLSAKFGLIPHDRPIPYYDQRMTPQRIQVLRPDVSASLEVIFAENAAWKEIFVCLGKDYLATLDGIGRLSPPNAELKVAVGPQGKKLAALHHWLYGESAARNHQPAPFTPQGRARLRGIEVALTPEQVMDAARCALAEGKGNPGGYQSWYVLVDEQKVAPKWLVSQLTGLPVGSFHSHDAKRLLEQLGIQVRRT